MRSLLQLSSQALGEALACGPGEVPNLDALPGAELATDVWTHWQHVLESAARPVTAGSTAAAAGLRPPPLQVCAHAPPAVCPVQLCMHA